MDQIKELFMILSALGITMGIYGLWAFLDYKINYKQQNQTGVKHE